MSKLNEIIEQNNIATDFVVGGEGPIDTSTAELVLRSTAVAADRLTPSQFKGLGKPAMEALTTAANAAQEIAPLHPADLEKLPNETPEEYRFRVTVWQPLHRLQAAVSQGEFKADDPKAVASVKRAVWLGSTAFEKVMTDPSAQQFGALQNTIHYFGGNTQAAAGRAARLAAEHSA